MAEAWGHIRVFGPPEHVAAVMAHAEALGVPVTPEVKTGGGCLRILAAPFVFMIAAGAATTLGAGGGGFIIGGLVAAWVWHGMKKAADRDANRQAQALRYPFPRVHGSARYSTDEDLRKGGLI
jgi:hypothetical protein